MKPKFKNIYLRNYPDLVRYIRNDFRKLGFSSKEVGDYVDWLEHNITQRPLLYITQVCINEVNRVLKPFSLIIILTKNGFQVQKVE